jgi:translation initiation factor 1
MENIRSDNPEARLVYSTGFGPVCPDCGKPKNSCVCRKLKREVVPAGVGPLRVRYETSGRKGKAVTLIAGLPLSEEALLEVAKKLKQQLATGGAVKDYVIELQGDQRKKAMQALRKLGYVV